jgi:hypothetical protein
MKYNKKKLDQFIAAETANAIQEWCSASKGTLDEGYADAEYQRWNTGLLGKLTDRQKEQLKDWGESFMPGATLRDIASFFVKPKKGPLHPDRLEAEDRRRRAEREERGEIQRRDMAGLEAEDIYPGIGVMAGGAGGGPPDWAPWMESPPRGIERNPITGEPTGRRYIGRHLHDPLDDLEWPDIGPDGKPRKPGIMRKQRHVPGLDPEIQRQHTKDWIENQNRAVDIENDRLRGKGQGKMTHGTEDRYRETRKARIDHAPEEALGDLDRAGKDSMNRSRGGKSRAARWARKAGRGLGRAGPHLAAGAAGYEAGKFVSPWLVNPDGTFEFVPGAAEQAGLGVTDIDPRTLAVWRQQGTPWETSRKHGPPPRQYVDPKYTSPYHRSKAEGKPAEDATLWNQEMSLEWNTNINRSPAAAVDLGWMSYEDWESLPSSAKFTAGEFTKPLTKKGEDPVWGRKKGGIAYVAPSRRPMTGQEIENLPVGGEDELGFSYRGDQGRVARALERQATQRGEQSARAVEDYMSGAGLPSYEDLHLDPEGIRYPSPAAMSREEWDDWVSPEPLYRATDVATFPDEFEVRGDYPPLGAASVPAGATYTPSEERPAATRVEDLLGISPELTSPGEPEAGWKKPIPEPPPVKRRPVLLPSQEGEEDDEDRKADLNPQRPGGIIRPEDMEENKNRKNPNNIILERWAKLSGTKK